MDRETKESLPESDFVLLHDGVKGCIPRSASYWKRRCLMLEAQLRDALAENALVSAERDEAEAAVSEFMDVADREIKKIEELEKISLNIRKISKCIVVSVPMGKP